ncbi:MAG: hypothetical protein ACI3XO_09590 [Eubacteriales bacterium]
MSSRFIQKMKLLFYDVEWNVAIREHIEDIPIEQQADFQFRVLKNNWRYWCADPFVFEYGGVTYIFMEVYDKLTQRGSIGYRIYKGKKVSNIKICLKSDKHLSYPFIFSDGTDVYLMPECYQSNRLEVYRAVQFPDKWEQDHTILNNISLCDTNLLEVASKRFLFTMPIGEPPFCYDKLYLYYQKEGAWYPSAANPVVCGFDHARNGGAIFTDHGRLVRPAQNCSNSYGEGLGFYKINHVDENQYNESMLCCLSINQIKPLGSKSNFDGIHTFNTDKKYDVIDLRRERTFQLSRIIFLIGNKLRSIWRK